LQVQAVADAECSGFAEDAEDRICLPPRPHLIAPYQGAKLAKRLCGVCSTGSKDAALREAVAEGYPTVAFATSDEYAVARLLLSQPREGAGGVRGLFQDVPSTLAPPLPVQRWVRTAGLEARIRARGLERALRFMAKLNPCAGTRWDCVRLYRRAQEWQRRLISQL